VRPIAVVFDCDGVLVDSEPHSRRSWVDVMRGLGHPGTEADVAECTGLGFLPTRAALARISPLPEPGTLWPMLMEALATSFDEHGLAPFADTMRALAAVEDAGIPSAVVSASPRERLDLTLDRSGLSGSFRVSVAGDEVEHPKPAPDGYLAALAGLGVVDPVGTIAIEDSSAGARSALNAGMGVLAVAREPGSRTSLELTGARVVDEVALHHLGL
jgi:HAD superfamily hydrolase (TIGR01509 family)